MVKDQSEAAELRALLHSYATMARDIKESKYLRYLDSGDKLDPREKIKNTAARVGLAVPKVGNCDSETLCYRCLLLFLFAFTCSFLMSSRRKLRNRSMLNLESYCI